MTYKVKTFGIDDQDHTGEPMLITEYTFIDEAMQAFSECIIDRAVYGAEVHSNELGHWVRTIHYRAGGC